MNPTVAIVGRPNVGKSTLLNRLAGRRVSIVHSTPGVTRDRVAVELELGGRSLELVDTGGIGIVDRDDLEEEIEAQIESAIRSAQLILFLVDARAGVHPLDVEIADRLRRHETPVLLAANKCETLEAKHQLAEFFRLGLGTPLPLSAEHGEGVADLEARIAARFPEGSAWPEPALRIAIVGRRNAGKSTLINALLEEERVIVSETPGTTRDAVDIRFEKDGKEFVLIDTAGMQRRARLKGDLEYYAQVRAIEAIQRSDVVVMMLDAVHGVSQLDKRIASEIRERHRSCLIAVNKWDLAKERTTTEEYGEYLAKMLPGLGHAPVIFLSARDGRNVLDVVSLAQSLAKQSRTRVGTGALNRAIQAIQDAPRPPFPGGKEPKILFGTQVSVSPPTIALVVNHPEYFSDGYRRFIEGRFRELLPFPEVAIRVFFREREGSARSDVARD